MLHGRSSVTALHIASRKGHLNVIDLLLKEGCDVNAQDRDGFTALHQTSRYGHLDVAKLLIANDCKLDLGAKSKQAERQTPLHYAVRHGYHNIAELLVQSGSDPNIAEVTRHPIKKEKEDTSAKVSKNEGLLIICLLKNSIMKVFIIC